MNEERRRGKLDGKKLMMPKTNGTAANAVQSQQEQQYQQYQREKKPIYLQNPRLKPTKLCYLMRTEPNAKEKKRRMRRMRNRKNERLYTHYTL